MKEREIFSFWQEMKTLSQYTLMVNGDIYDGLSTNESQGVT
jgi:hypothetical protein